MIFLWYNQLDKHSANHSTSAGHTFRNVLRMATVNGIFGSMDANQGNMLPGWDTNQFSTKGKVTLESLAAYAQNLKDVMPVSSRQNYPESVMNDILFS